MAELKTQKNKSSVAAFLKQVPEEVRRQDALAVKKMMETVTGEKSIMWGDSMIGYGQYHYESTRSSQKGDWPLVAFSPRKQNLVIYIMSGVNKYPDLLKKLGKYKTGSSCLYLNRLTDVDITVLEKLIRQSYVDMKKKYAVW